MGVEDGSVDADTTVGRGVLGSDVDDAALAYSGAAGHVVLQGKEAGQIAVADDSLESAQHGRRSTGAQEGIGRGVVAKDIEERIGDESGVAAGAVVGDAHKIGGEFLEQRTNGEVAGRPCAIEEVDGEIGSGAGEVRCQEVKGGDADASGDGDETPGSIGDSEGAAGGAGDLESLAGGHVGEGPGGFSHNVYEDLEVGTVGVVAERTGGQHAEGAGQEYGLGGGETDLDELSGERIGGDERAGETGQQEAGSQMAEVGQGGVNHVQPAGSS